MISKWRWIIVQFSRKLWVRALLFAVLAVITALAAIFLKHLIPDDLSTKIGADAVDNILNILASSMLAVTTFSLSVMVAAYTAATSSVSPRATRLLMEDTTTQNVLGTFVGSFLFSLVGITALSTGVYGNEGRVILFVVTLGVIALIVATVLLWIEHLSHLGRVGETSDRVEQATLKAVQQRIQYPWLGGAPLTDAQQIPSDALPLYAEKIGYIQHIDVAAISHWAEKAEARVYITSLPGAFVHPKRMLARVVGTHELDQEKLQSAFSIANERSFDQDPRFGLSVLSEIASRALSPAVNDPGTAIEIIGRGLRILCHWKEPNTGDSECIIEYPQVLVPPLKLEEFFDDFFTPIARDGVNMLEVQIRLQKALDALAQLGEPFYRIARDHAQQTLQRTNAVMEFDGDKQVLQELVDDLTHQSGHQP
ncbi:DUF2254 domain-containing protein [Cellvibrio sp. PSBB006]|uniref:DUF2254 domain-containing protein n=1 Tax=Cellvibrio sp. PSBB006 TaxID=1987723 RepID=UPI000B3B966F|nr:DUF2254 domain-containing protein [Cellvibrio sp. PSBB006]ARU29039.1 hypothetical protein CBR65_17205 [Cellvibrio sp. PSBB006]